jgi:hypothetical protein
MTSVKAFDELMVQFIKELKQTFPDKAPKTVLPCSEFVAKVGPWSRQLTAREDAFFVPENEMAKSMNLIEIWNDPECSTASKQAIWQYLSSMYMIGTTLSMFPPDTLSAIERAAEDCAKNMQGNQLDEKTLMDGMQNMLRQMMGNGGPLANLGLEPKKPSSGRRKKNSRKI